MYEEPESLIASCAALRIETPIGLGPPFCVSGRIIPTRTGPAPNVSPTSGPPAGGAAGVGAPPKSFGISKPGELQPASVKMSPPPSTARLVTLRLAAGCSTANLILTSRLSREGAGERVVPSCSKCPRAAAAIRWLSTEIVAFSPALGYASIIEPARRPAD
jgi:hypothetical protein